MANSEKELNHEWQKVKLLLDPSSDKRTRIGDLYDVRSYDARLHGLQGSLEQQFVMKGHHGYKLGAIKSYEKPKKAEGVINSEKVASEHILN